MAAPPIYRSPLDGTEMVRVLKDGRFYMTTAAAVAATALGPVLARLAALEAAGAAQATRDAAQDAALTGEAAARQAGDTAEASARTSADAAQGTRLAALEARPEEVAHFTATAKFPALAIGARFTLALTGLTPAKAGDILRMGEQVEAWPTGDVPAGITLGRPVVTADNTVAIPCTAGLAVAASSAAMPFALAALR